MFFCHILTRKRKPNKSSCADNRKRINRLMNCNSEFKLIWMVTEEFFTIWPICVSGAGRNRLRIIFNRFRRNVKLSAFVVEVPFENFFVGRVGWKGAQADLSPSVALRHRGWPSIRHGISNSNHFRIPRIQSGPIRRCFIKFHEILAFTAGHLFTPIHFFRQRETRTRVLTSPFHSLFVTCARADNNNNNSAAERRISWSEMKIRFAFFFLQLN